MRILMWLYVYHSEIPKFTTQYIILGMLNKLRNDNKYDFLFHTQSPISE